MRKGIWKAVIVVGLCLAAGMLPAGRAAAATAMPSDYVIGPGDVLDISVWKNEELTKLVTVLPDGRISFPLIGRVAAGGKTVDQLSAELRQKLTRYVPDIELSVIVHQVNSMLIYVIGKVNNPGRFVVNADVNVLQALAMAGGLNPFAKSGKIKIFRQAADGTRIFDFDYDDVSKGERLELNIMLQRGDVVVVP
jgi:polysaccharide export outer membrane protein